jgi:Raf kinase inhibitor-like YbhB/YbcL family protein
MEIKLKSPAFKEGDMIPEKHTCDGEDISPNLEWSPTPADCKSLALICDDPDSPSGTWVHWVIYNIPAQAGKLTEGIPAIKTLKDGSLQGINDFRKIGYGGPCPHSGTHRYYFKLYALDAVLRLEAGATKTQLLRAIDGHILTRGELMGRYHR